MEPTTSFYQRPLPADLVAFSSEAGRALFREALATGHLESFFALAEQFHTQADPAFCGLGSLVVVLNALGVDPGRLWKGPWRWFSEELLDCCAPLDDVRAKGLTLEELACLSRCNGAAVEVVRARASDEEALRAMVQEVTRTPRAPLAIAAYARGGLGQTGDGHFSPIGGYHPDKDLVLLLDVARFKYPPHWVPLGKLFAAMATTDPASGGSRGWLVLRPRDMPRAVVFGLSGTVHVGAIVTGAEARAHVALAGLAPDATAPHVIAAFAEAMREVVLAVDVRPHPAAPAGAMAHMLAALRATDLYALVTTALGAAPAEASPSRADVVAALALATPDATWSELRAPLRDEVLTAIDRARAAPELAAETATLREQIASIARLASCRPAPAA